MNERKPEGVDFALNAGLGAFLPCPFCGWHDIRHMQAQLNEAVMMHWPQCARCRCRLDDYKAAIPELEPWRAESAVRERWNLRAPNDGLSGGEPKAKPSRLNP